MYGYRDIQHAFVLKKHMKCGGKTMSALKRWDNAEESRRFRFSTFYISRSLNDFTDMASKYNRANCQYVLFCSFVITCFLDVNIPKGSLFCSFGLHKTKGFWLLLLVFKLVFKFYDFISYNSFPRLFSDIIVTIFITTREETAEPFCFPMQ